MTVTIRPLEMRDVPQVVALEAALFGRGAWNESMLRQELAAPARTYVVAANGADPSTVLGYAGFWYDGDDAELMTIGVDSARQRQGIARRLMNWLVDAAGGLGARRMLLEVRVDNDPALALYRGFGFRVMGRRKRYYQPEGVDAFTMELDLRPHVVGFVPSGVVALDDNGGRQ